MPSPDVLRNVVTSWTPGIKPTWRISEVRQALRLHAEGDFTLSAQLVDSMGEDDVLPGVLEKWVDAVLGSDFELCPVESPNRQLSKRLADQFGPLWWDMFPESELDDFLRWYRMLGTSVAVLDWARDASRWTPKLRVLHPQFLRRDQLKQQWIYSAQEGQLIVTPGDGKWILLSDGQRGWMRGAVRGLAILWIAKQLTIRDWNRYNERHGLPLIKAFAPAMADELDKEGFWEDVRQLGASAVADLPTHLGGPEAKQELSYDLELLEAKDRSFDSFKEQLERADRRIIVFLLGSNLSTEINDTGSRAAAETHRGVEVSKATAAAKKLSTELRWQALFPACAYNVTSATLEVTPWPEWDTEPPEDTKVEAEDQELFGKALKALQDAGFDVENVDDLAEKRGLKLKKRPEPVAPVPTPDDSESPPAVADDAEQEATDKAVA